MFDTPLTTNIAAGDPDLPGILNETRDRLNQTRAEADYIPRRNIETLVSPQWTTTGGMAEVLKFGPILGFRFVLTATQDIPPALLHTLVTGLPNPFLPQVASAPNGIGRIAGQNVVVRRNETGLAIYNLDESPVGFSEGDQLRLIFNSWSHSRGSSDQMPGVPATT